MLVWADSAFFLYAFNASENVVSVWASSLSPSNEPVLYMISFLSLHNSSSTYMAAALFFFSHLSNDRGVISLPLIAFHLPFFLHPVIVPVWSSHIFASSLPLLPAHSHIIPPTRCPLPSLPRHLSFFFSFWFSLVPVSISHPIDPVDEGHVTVNVFIWSCNVPCHSDVWAHFQMSLLLKKNKFKKKKQTNFKLIWNAASYKWFMVITGIST